MELVRTGGSIVISYDKIVFPKASMFTMDVSFVTTPPSLIDKSPGIPTPEREREESQVKSVLPAG